MSVSPVTGWEGRLRVGISATLCWPFPWGNNVSTFLRFHNDPVKLVGKGEAHVALLRPWSGPSLGAFQQWHFCKMIMAPNKTGGGVIKLAFLRRHDGPL